MGSILKDKPHILCLPFPAQGHVNPFMHLAKLLHSTGFYITFVNTEFYHQSLLRSEGPDALKGLDDFQFEKITDGYPVDIDAKLDVPALCYSTQNNCAAPFIDLVMKLNSSPDIPKVTYIISDGMMSFAVQVAQKLGIPEAQFWTASACGMMGYLQYCELINRGLIPLKDESYLDNGYLDTHVDWIPGMKDIRLKDIPSFIRTTDPDDIMLNYFRAEAQNCLNASAIILNTFDDLESEVLGAISFMCPKIYTMGHLPLLSSPLPESEMKSLRSSLWKEDLDCMAWLDNKEANSVVYVNFGSMTVMSDQQLVEFAWGLANSKYPFLWIIRPGMLMGNSAILPVEFMEEIKDRGVTGNWCPQEEVLCHPSVGGFLTHCGWNSMIESLCGGVPMICWPFFAEQFTNCHYACKEWGIGLQIDSNVKREQVEILVKEMMEGEKEKSMRKNALKWKEKVEYATKDGGSSNKNFNKFVEEVLKLKT